MMKHNTNTLCWLYNIFKKGFHQPLSINDTHFNKFEDFSGLASKQLELNWNLEIEKSKNPNLLKVLIKTFGILPLIFGGIYLFIEMISRILIPFYVGCIISYYTSDHEPLTKEELYRSIVGLVTFLLLTAFLYSPLKMNAFEIGLRMRAACSSLVYQKTLNITDPHISGLGLDLLTNDTQSINNLLIGINHIWKAPLESFIIVYIIYYEIGVQALFGILIMLSVIPIQTVLTRLIDDCEMHLNLANDKRIRFVKEIINQIKMIKIYAWEKLFDKTAQKLREREINIISQRSYLYSILYLLNILPRVATFITIIMFVLNGNLLTPKQIFMTSLYYQFINLSITQSFQSLAEYRQAVNSINRIQRFLLITNGNINKINDLLRNRIHNTTSLDKGVFLDHVSAIWKDGTNGSLYSIDLVLQSDRIYGITGESGCGKSTLLNTIVAELEPTEGKIEIRGTISYGSQEPWLFNSTIRQNILFGEEFNENRYKTVCRICALDRDFEILKFGDETLIADDYGQCLSVAQKSKINLARTIYRQADIYLIDDPLCIANSQEGLYIFENCLQKFLKGKCVVLVTNEIKCLKLVNQIIMMKDGRIKEIGKFDPLLFGKYSSTTRDSVNYAERSSQEKEDTNSNLKIKHRGTLSNLQVYYQRLENNKLLGIAIALIFFTQILMSGIDIFLFQRPGRNTSTLEIKTEDLKTLSFNDNLLEIKSYLYMFTILLIFLGYFSFQRTLTIFQISLGISRNLHNKLCQVILNATLQFYTRSTSEKLIESFSHDMKNIDVDLSMDLLDCLTFLVEAIFIIICIVTTNQLLIVPSLAVILIFYGIRQIIKKLLEHITNIELIHQNTFKEHQNSSLQGAIIIRAFNAKSHFINKFNKCQDNSLTITYLQNLMLNVFSYIIDITSCFYIIMVIISFLFMSPFENTGNNIGLAITQVFILKCICQKGMHKSIDAEIRLPSVSNILKNCDCECEPTAYDLLLTKSLSKRTKYGHISFKNVNLKSLNDKLTGLNFEIKSKEKIAILGMEKSLITNALFRFNLPECGVIKIDGYNIQKINLNFIRRNISIISQNPIIFSGTVRFNLDPLNERSDSEIMKLLHQITSEADLEEVIINLHDNIEYSNLRQKQIICMARSLLAHNKVVIVDESTGNIDKQFNVIIHRTIQKLCADCTIIILAKQLNHIMNCDRIMILDKGRLVDYDQPYKIIKKSNEYFNMLLDKYDEIQRTELINIAMNTCKLL